MDSFLGGNDRRGHERFATNAMAQYFIKDTSMRYMDCELANVSRSGIAIRVSGSENIDSGMEILLEITLPGSLDQINIAGIIEWFQGGESILVGIKFDRLMAPEVLTRLIVC